MSPVQVKILFSESAAISIAFMKGSELANARMANVAESLNSLGMEPERVKLAQVAIDEYDKVSEIINDFVEEVVGMGPNPFKGW